MNEKRERLEKKYAGHLLRHKEHGYSILYILQVSAFRYLLLILAAALVLVIYQFNQRDGGIYLFLLGLLVGAVMRDFGWLRQGKKVWPLYEKVIDWAKVKEIAEKGQLAG